MCSQQQQQYQLWYNSQYTTLLPDNIICNFTYRLCAATYYIMHILWSLNSCHWIIDIVTSDCQWSEEVFGVRDMLLKHIDPDLPLVKISSEVEFLLLFYTTEDIISPQHFKKSSIIAYQYHCFQFTMSHVQFLINNLSENQKFKFHMCFQNTLT